VIRRRATAASGSDLAALLETFHNTIPLILVLDGIQDPHNLGACLRTANAAGVNAVVIPGDRAVGVNATVRKVASGAAEHTPVVTVTNLSRALTQLKQAGVWCFGLSESASADIYATDLTVPLALVLGAEGKGLRQNTRLHCDQLLSIPMRGQVESLNVSAAAAVCLFETVRQRKMSKK
jgi:23S rRNA (guanosine2251-2'-O)-methyltransferase